MNPSWPECIACTTSSASPPRASPRMMRSGRIRSAFLTSARSGISPRPSMLADRPTTRIQCVQGSSSSGTFSIVMTRSLGGMNVARMLTSVVLPVEVPPEMIMLTLALTHASRNSAAWGVSAPLEM